MSGMSTGQKGQWAWAAGAAAAILALVLLLFSQVRSPAPAPAPVRVRPGISLVAKQDEATLLDPKPLFLPTKWNAAQKEVAWPEPGGALENYPVRRNAIFSDTDLLKQLDPTPPIATPARPVDALTIEGPAPLALGFGRAEAPVTPWPARGAVVEVVSVRTGRPALSGQALDEVKKLAAAARPPGNQPWQPMEFLVAVDAAGLAGPPTMMEPRSGVEEVDNYFRNYLVQTLRLGARLAPGFYRISVGP